MIVTSQEVVGWTTKTPTTENLTIAQSVIEVYASISLEDPTIFSPADLRRLKQAVAWQSVWLPNQVSVETRSSVKSQTADGVSITVENDSDFTLAPLAKMLLRQLSWRNGSIKPRNRSVEASPDKFLTDDSVGDWHPLENWG